MIEGHSYGELLLALIGGAAVGIVYFVWVWRSVVGLAGRRRFGSFVAGLAARLALIAAVLFAFLTSGQVGLPQLAAAFVGFAVVRLIATSIATSATAKD